MMKSILFSFAAFIFVIGITSCENNDSDVRQSARESLGVADNNTQAATSNPSTIPNNPVTTPPPAVNSGVDHYTCPNNCEGSGGSTQVECPVCGTQYVHNQAYHAQVTTPSITPLGTSSTPLTPATPPTAQNAAGVYHYTCANGCEGGAGGAGPCGTCGSPLAHNTAFHNN